MGLIRRESGEIKELDQEDLRLVTLTQNHPFVFLEWFWSKNLNYPTLAMMYCMRLVKTLQNRLITRIPSWLVLAQLRLTWSIHDCFCKWLHYEKSYCTKDQHPQRFSEHVAAHARIPLNLESEVTLDGCSKRPLAQEIDSRKFLSLINPLWPSCVGSTIRGHLKFRNQMKLFWKWIS